MKQNKMMTVLTTLCILLAGGISFCGYEWYHSVEEREAQSQQYDEKVKQLSQSIDKQSIELQKERDKAKLAIQNNTNPASKENEDMYLTIKKVFDCFYNFTPKTYTSREKDIKNELSKEMREQLFPQNVQNYQGTLTSSIEDIEIYSNVYYEKVGDKTALVRIKYKTKYTGQETRHLTALWKVEYNVDKHQITNIEEAVEGDH